MQEFRLMTGARPTGGLHIGHLLAAFDPFVNSGMIDGSFFVVSDLHMLTTKFTPEATRGLPAAVRRLVSEAIGFGVDPERTRFYLQSSMPWQARTYVLLQSLADRDRLELHGSFEEMAAGSAHIRPPTLGLLGYPILENSDVLTLGATHVAVGDNNHSHFEQLRDILAELRAGWGLDLPTPQVLTSRRNVIGLDGDQKMSKSLKNAIMFSEGPDGVRERIKDMVAVGPSGVAVAAEYLEALGAHPDEVQDARERTADGSFPPELRVKVADLLVELVEPVWRRSTELQRDPGYLDGLLAFGTQEANAIGEARYAEIANALGLLRVSP